MIIGLLSRAGLVYSARGKGGGYKLVKPAEKCSVGSVLKAAEGSLAPVTCLELSENICPNAGACKTLPMWTELERRIEEYLESVSIADLVSQTASVETGSCI